MTNVTQIILGICGLLAVVAVVVGLADCRRGLDACKTNCLKTNRPVVECYLGCS